MNLQGAEHLYFKREAKKYFTCHQTGERVYKCPQCERSFIDTKKFEKYSVSQAVFEKSFSCPHAKINGTFIY